MIWELYMKLTRKSYWKCYSCSERGTGTREGVQHASTQHVVVSRHNTMGVMR